MDGNSYSRILKVFRGESSELAPTGETSEAGLGAAPVKMRRGEVTQRAPLMIRVMGIEMPAEVFYINERLVKGAKWKSRVTSAKSSYGSLSGSLNGTVNCPGGWGSPSLSTVEGGQLHSSDTVIDEATVEQLEIDLDIGDQVLLLTEDDQIFYIVMKVVNAV